MALSRFVLPYADVGAGIRPSSGAKLFFYATGTSTPKSTFTDATGGTANTNPVIANANGVFPSIFLEGVFNIALKDANDVQIWTEDPYTTSLFTSPVFSTVAAMVASTPTALDGVDVIFTVGMFVSVVDYATGNNSGVLFGSIVAGGTGTADGGSYIDLANGMQWKQNFSSNSVSLKQFGAQGDDSEDDTAEISAVKSASNYYYVPEGAYPSTGNYASTGSYNYGPGLITTSDGRRAHESINMTAPPSAWNPGNGILDDFDGDFLSPLTTQMNVTGPTTVGDPVNGSGYTQYTQSAGRFTRAYVTAGKNANAYNNADRTGWAANDTRVSHFGKADATAYSAFCFVAAKDPTILKCQGQPAAVLFNGGTTAGDDQVILNPIEINLHGGVYDVVGKGVIVNQHRNNHDEDEGQFWTGFRVQSLGSMAAGAGFQAVGAFDVGLDFTGALVNKAVCLQTNQEIHFDAVTGYHIPTAIWVASVAYATDELRYNDQKIYKCVAAGTGGTTPPTHSSGTASDGGVNWLFVTGNDFKSHAKSFGGTRMKESGGVWSLNVKGVGLMQASTTAINLLKPVAVTGGVTSTTQFVVGTNKVLGARGSSVADATDAGTAITQLNSLLAKLRTHGLIET